jgi:hypothetical protein
MGEKRDAHSLVTKADRKGRLARHAQGRIILKLILETCGTQISTVVIWESVSPFREGDHRWGLLSTIIIARVSCKGEVRDQLCYWAIKNPVKKNSKRIAVSGVCVRQRETTASATLETSLTYKFHGTKVLLPAGFDNHDVRTTAEVTAPPQSMTTDNTLCPLTRLRYQSVTFEVCICK